MKTTYKQLLPGPQVSRLLSCLLTRSCLFAFGLLFANTAFAEYWPRPFGFLNYENRVFTGGGGSYTYYDYNYYPNGRTETISIDTEGNVQIDSPSYNWDTFSLDSNISQIGTYSKFQFSGNIYPCNGGASYWTPFDASNGNIPMQPFNGVLVAGVNWVPVTYDPDSQRVYYAASTGTGYMTVDPSTDNGATYSITFSVSNSDSPILATYNSSTGLFVGVYSGETYPLFATDQNGSVQSFTTYGTATNVNSVLPNSVWINGVNYTFFSTSGTNDGTTITADAAYYWSSSAGSILRIDSALNISGSQFTTGISGTFPSDPANYPTFTVSWNGLAAPANSGGAPAPLAYPSFGGPPGLRVAGVLWTLYAEVL